MANSLFSPFYQFSKSSKSLLIKPSSPSQLLGYFLCIKLIKGFIFPFCRKLQSPFFSSCTLELLKKLFPQNYQMSNIGMGIFGKLLGKGPDRPVRASMTFGQSHIQDHFEQFAQSNPVSQSTERRGNRSV